MCNMTTCGCTSSRVTADEPITTPVSDRWPVQITWHIVVFVVRTIGTVREDFVVALATRELYSDLALESAIH